MGHRRLLFLLGLLFLVVSALGGKGSPAKGALTPAKRAGSAARGTARAAEEKALLKKRNPALEPSDDEEDYLCSGAAPTWQQSAHTAVQFRPET